MSTTPHFSKRELREQRRAARESAEAAERVRAARRRLLTRLAVATAAAAALVAIAIAVSSRGHTTSPAAATQAAGVVTGVPEHDGVLGAASAKVTVTEFLDLQCPVCKAASQDLLPGLIDRYVRPGDVKLQARTLHFIGNDSTRAAEVA